jgi:hypothetical protein
VHHIFTRVRIVVLSLVCSTLLPSAEERSLEPLFAFARPDDYVTAVHEILVGKGEYYWMIVLPSFRPEYAVLLKSRPGASDPKRFDAFLEVAQAESKIDDEARDLRDGGRLRREIRIARKSKTISEADQHMLAVVSFAVHRKTRMPATPNRGVDGTTYLFCFDTYSGQAWEPTGETRQLVNAWSALADYVRANSPEAEEVALSAFRRACMSIPTEEPKTKP